MRAGRAEAGKTLRGPRAVGPDRLRGLGSAPTPACSSTRHHQRVAHLPGRRAIKRVNPCSEYMFLDDTACNLASLNLLKFYDRRRPFDVEPFRHASGSGRWSSRSPSTWRSSRQGDRAQQSYDFRTLGLGYANLGALLMVQGIPYDSPEGRAGAAR